MIKLFEDRKNDMELIEILLDMFINIGGASKSSDHYKMDTRAGDALFSFSITINNSFDFIIMFGDKEKAQELTNCDANGTLSVRTTDHMTFLEEVLKVFGKVALPEIERTTKKYNI